MRFLFTALLLTSVARAGVESELVTQGVEASRAADFERCTEVLQRALKESLTREEKVLTYRTLALCHSALDHTDQARNDFVALLRIDDHAELDRSVAPKVRALFEEARASIATGHAPAVEEAALPLLNPTIAKAQEGKPLPVSLSYPGGVARSVQLFYRGRGDARYQTSSAPASAEGQVTLTVPGESVRPPALELYLTALDGSGVALARAGSFADPITVEVTAARKRRRTWVWGVVGGVVVAAALGVGLGVGLTVGRSGSNADLTIIAPSK